MSQYALVPNNPRYEVILGWDPPLANFFLQVRDLEVDEDRSDPITVWLGADDYAAEPNVDSVLEEAARWAEIPPDLRGRLLADRASEGVRPRPKWMASPRTDQTDGAQ
jgi:hypothetical protein